MTTYKDKISGETLYVSDKGYAIVYYKDKTHRIIHRVDGPALEWNDGRRRWLQNGKVHRMDGPAIEWVDGGREWWIDDEGITGIVHGRYVGPTWLQEKLDIIKGI